MDWPNLPEIELKVTISTPTSHFTNITNFLYFGSRRKIIRSGNFHRVLATVVKNEKKWQWNKIIIKFHSLSIMYSFISLRLFENEEKLITLLFSFSFRRVATSGFGNSSVDKSCSRWVRQAVVKWRVNTESLRIQHSIAARHSY